MKNINKVSRKMHHVLRVVIFSCFFLALSNVSEATHFRYGSMSWQKISGTTYKITVSQAWRKSYFTGVVQGGTVNTGVLDFGDGTATSVLLEVSTINPTDDWFYGAFVYTKTYPAAPAITNYNVTFTGCCRLSSLVNAADGGYSSSTVINVGTTNNSPIATTDPIKNVQINTINTFSVALNDPDGDVLTYRLATAAEMGATNYILPAGVSINASTGAVTFNGTGKVVGQQYALGVVVSDGKTSVLVDFLVNVIVQHSPPQFDYSVTPVNAHIFQTAPGQPVSFNVKAFDSEPGTFVLLSAVGLPTGASLSPSVPANPATTTFTWIPSPTQFGTYVMNFTATNNFGVQVSTALTIVVSLKPVFNVPPTPVYGIELATVAGTPIQFTVQASDPDPLDVVRLTNVLNKPATATLTPMPSAAGNPTTANFSWNPVLADWGEREIQFEATDSYGDKAYHKIGFVVNTPPIFTSTPPASDVIVNHPYTYTITGLDPDIPYGDSLELIGVGVPAWLTLTDNGNGSGSLTGIPSIADAGTYTISLYLEDIYHHSGTNGVPRQVLTITVIPCIIGLDSTFVQNVTCNGLANGSAEIIFTGGFGPFTYAWSNGSTDSVLTNAAPGTYLVSITDAYNCSIYDTLVITEPAPLTATLNRSDFNGFGVSCKGESNGSASVAVSGGTASYDIVWSNGSTDSSLTGLTAGIYSVKVTDAHDCVVRDSVILTEPVPFVLTSSQSDYNGFGVTCKGASNGFAHIVATGGVPGYHLVWSTGSPDTLTALSAGTYYVTATDANGCMDSVTVVITEPTQLTVTSSHSDYNGFGVTCKGAANGAAKVVAAGGVPSYTTVWSNGSTDSSLTGLTAGTYTATLTDKNGCTAAASVVLTEPTILTNVISNLSNHSGYNISCFGGTNGTAASTVKGGVAPYTYLWSNGKTTKSVGGLSAAAYSVIATDKNGCTASASVTLTQPTKIVATITSPTVIGSYNTSCSVDGDGMASVTGTGGVLPYAAAWNTGATSASITGLLAGTYTATLTDKNGCAASSSVTLTKPENCNCVTAPVAPTVTCASCTKVLDGQSNVMLNAGDNACVANTFTGNINMNGGNLTICGTATLQWLNIPNNSKVIILGTVTLSGINFNGANAVLENFGTLVVNGDLNVTGKLTNNKTITVNQSAHFNSGSYVINNGTLNVTSDMHNNNYFANNGLLNVGNTIYNNSNCTMINNCTTKSGSYFVNNNVVFTNNGTIMVANDIRFNSATGTIASGSIVKTKNIYLNSTALIGATASCALINATNYTQINQTSLNGKISLCDANGFEVKNNLTLLSGANTNCTACNYSGAPVTSNLRDADPADLASVQADQTVSMYPNPVTNGAEVTISSSVEIVSANVFDNMGRMVLTSSDAVFNVSDLSTGIYLVKIQDVLGNVTTTKLVVR